MNLTQLSSRRQTKANRLAVHALHKSGSIFLLEFFRELARRIDVPFYSINNDPPDEQLVSTSDRQFLVCPLRGFVVSPLGAQHVEPNRRIFQVRDPRDILVSQYYSMGWYHTAERWSSTAHSRREKIQRVPLAEYCLNEACFGSPSLLDRYQPILQLPSGPQCLVVQYETMVTDFPQWVSSIMRFMGLAYRPLLKRRLVRRFGQTFTAEGEGTHKRHVTPGEHRLRLPPDVIDQLNQQYATILDRFDYSRRLASLSR